MDRLRALAGLRLRLLLRPTAGRGSFGIAMLVAKLAVFVPASLLLAYGAFATIAGAPPELHEAMVPRALLLLWASWILQPLLGMPGGPFADPRRLAIYPVPRFVLWTAALLGTLTSGSVLFLIPTVFAIALAIDPDPLAALIRVSIAILFLVHGTLLVQAISSALSRILRSRRFHDLSAVAISTACVALYLVVRSAFASDTSGNRPIGEVLLAGEMPFLATLTPAHLVSMLLLAIGKPLTLATLDAGVVFTLMTILIAAFGYHMHGKALRGEAGETAKPQQRRDRSLRSRAPRTNLRARRRREQSGETLAFLGKEMRLLSREPMVKAQLIVQSGFLLLPMLLGLSLVGDGADEPPAYLPELLLTGLSFSIVVVESSLLFNMFGLEGRGFTHLLATPLSRRRILVGKNVFYFALFGLVNLAVLAIFSGAIHFAYGTSPSILAGHFGRFALFNAALLALTISLGNLTSILFPVRLSSVGANAMGFENTGSESLSRLLMRSAATGAILLALAPLAILVSLPRVRDLGPEFYLFAIPLVVAVLFGVYAMSLRVGETLLARREPELLRYFAEGGA